MADVRDAYFRDGYAAVPGLVPAEVCRLLVDRVRIDTGDAPLPVSAIRDYPNLLARPAFEIYSHLYPPLDAFLWGLTPKVADLTGLALIPTYCYFRLYREGDVCRVHSDRQACEHSLSLTLDYSDGEPWPLEFSPQRLDAPSALVTEDFGSAPSASVAMAVGDAVLYQGVHHRHGRTSPNPNAWSAHLFLHWVEAGGPYADFAFDRRPYPAPANFSFA